MAVEIAKLIESLGFEPSAAVGSPHPGFAIQHRLAVFIGAELVEALLEFLQRDIDGAGYVACPKLLGGAHVYQGWCLAAVDAGHELFLVDHVVLFRRCQRQANSH